VRKSITPDYLTRIGLLETAPDGDIAFLLRRALEKVAFLPFGLIVDKWRWDVFSGEVAPAEYNPAWWEMRRRYQGIVPPSPRSDSEFDPGAKFHVPANVPYIRYFLAHILQFQFHRALVRAAGSGALVVAHTSSEVTVQLPSGAFRTLLGTCRAEVGGLAGGGRSERPFIKAGKKVLAFRSLARPPFKVRGVAMNPVNHPHGGGAHQHVGRPSTVSSGTWPGAKVGRFSRSQRRKRLTRKTRGGG
jgi:hypothetical protein